MVKYWDLSWDLWEWWCVSKSQHVQLTILILFLSLHPACRVCSPICLNGVFLKILHASPLTEFSCEEKLARCVRTIYQVGIAFLLIFTNAAQFCFFFCDPCWLWVCFHAALFAVVNASWMRHYYKLIELISNGIEWSDGSVRTSKW